MSNVPSLLAHFGDRHNMPKSVLGQHSITFNSTGMIWEQTWPSVAQLNHVVFPRSLLGSNTPSLLAYFLEGDAVAQCVLTFHDTPSKTNVTFETTFGPSAEAAREELWKALELLQTLGEHMS